MYYVVKFKEQFDTDKGPKWISDQYLIAAESVTDAEVKLTEALKEGLGEFQIESVSKSKLTKIIS